MKNLETIWYENKDKFWVRKLPLIVLVVILLFSLGAFGIAKKKESSLAKSQGKEAEVKPTQYNDFRILIPKLNIVAPIIPDVDGNDKDAYFKALESGVAHYKGTAKPGDGSNIFIFGHSSFYFWKPGDYKEIFKPLDGLEKGDVIIIWREGKEYKYTVTEIKLVEPTEVSVLNPTKTEQLTLMTCWPPGTTEKRLIVIAKPI